MHEIKISRSRALAPHLPKAQGEIDASISPVLLERLTASELAEVRRCLDRHWHKAVAHTEVAILSEGAIFDPAVGKMRELASIPGSDLYAEAARRRGAKRQTFSGGRNGGRPPSCLCGKCPTCQRREQMRRYRSRKH